MVSNTNSQITWRKINCNQYSVENHTTETVTVTITGETNDFELTLEIESRVDATFDIPSDGVYKICVEGCDEEVIINTSEDVDSVRTILTVLSFNGDTPIPIELVSFNGNVIYDQFIHGASDTTNQANLIAALNTALGAGNHELVPPGVIPTAQFAPIGPDPDNWRLIMSHPTEVGDFIQTNGTPLGRTRWEDPEFFCRFQIANYTGSNNWLISLRIEGVNVMEAPLSPFWTRYDMTNGDSRAAFNSHIAQYMYNTYGFGLAIEDSPFVIIIPDQELCCPDIEGVTYADLTINLTPVVWCDYLYELCAIYTCIISKLRDLVCSDCDPCKNDCSEELNLKKKKARQDLMYINALFMHALVPLITEDRLKYMGDLTIDESRVECSMKIKDLYEKLVDFTKRCGECDDCDCEDCDCGCGCCEPNTPTKCNNC